MKLYILFYDVIKQVNNIIKQTNGLSTQYVIPNVKHTPHKEMPELILYKASNFIKKINDT